MRDHYDALETRDPEARERDLLARLPRQVEHAQKNAAGFARILKGIDSRKIVSRAALAALPVTRKSDLKALLQAEIRPLGGLNATPVEKLAKIFSSPGPIYEPEGYGKDWWRTARALYAAGFRPGDLVANTRVSLHAGRLDARNGRAACGAPSCPPAWTDRDAGRGDRRPADQRTSARRPFSSSSSRRATSSRPTSPA
jgi:phenylacetate-coenzyme A ligase PaaK-like adenylate-forming protein